MAILTHLRRKHHQPPSPSGGLSDTNLLIRYYLDEGTDGATTPTTANDDGPSSMDLTIDFAGSDAAWTVDSGQTGLDFIGTGAGRAIASHSIGASGNVIRDNLNGSQVVTLEFVAILDVPNGSHGRVFGTTAAGANGSCMIVARPGPLVNFRINEINYEQWDWVTGTRDVWHVIVDTTQAVAADRVTVYKNGSSFTSTVITAIPQNTTITIGATEWIVLMNRETDAARQTDGKFYYAAMYNEAFNASRVSDHYDVLTLDDDTP